MEDQGPDNRVESALVRANERFAAEAENRVTPADVDAALARAREAIESLTQASAGLQEGLPAADPDLARAGRGPGL